MAEPIQSDVPPAAPQSRGESAQPPEAPVPLQVGTPKSYAGGIPAVTNAMKHVIGKAGLIHGTKLLLQLNQTQGYDCPGCAWPDPDTHRATAEFCENGAKAIAEEGTQARVTPEFFKEHSIAQLSQQSDYWLGLQGRLTHPMILREGGTHYEPISWQDAFDLVGRELRALGTPDEAAFYTSGRTSNEAAFLYQLFVREFGTNNLPDCSNMCHESSGSGLSETLGIGKGTVTLEDFDHAKVILVIGQNPGTNHPRMLSALQSAAKKGAKIVSINPLPEAGLIRFKHPQQVTGMLGSGTPLASHFLQVRINGDVAVLQGISKALLEGGHVDKDYVAANTEGFADWAASVQRTPWDEIVLNGGVSEQQLREVAALCASTDKIIACWAMGLTQHQNAVDNIREVVNLLLMRGAMGKPGAGACPVRGHSNVQGDRTMGIWEKPRPAFLDSLEKATGISPPRHHGLDVVESIQAMLDGKVKVFFAMGGNFLSATPDTEVTARALRTTRLTAHVSTKLNRAHLVAGRTALILPCLGRTETDVQEGREQFVTTENSMGVVQGSKGRARPASEFLLSEPQIVARLARATLGGKSKVQWESLAADYDRVRDLIERVIPGFEKYNERARKPGGFYLPNGPREGRFTNAGGKGRFTAHAIPKWELKAGQLLMMTIRTHDQFNTTIYGLEDRYRGISGDRRVVLMNREDLKALGLAERDTVDLTSHWNGETRIARRFQVLGYDIPRGCCATYFPEANVLVPLHHVAHTSGTPASKSVVVTLQKVQTPMQVQA